MQPFWSSTRSKLSLLVFFASLGLTACSDGDAKIPVFPVTGRVVYQGQPAEGALVSLHPIDEKLPAALQPSGKAKADGTFSLTTYETGDGAPAGKYAATVFWPAPPASPVEAPDSGPDRLRGRYLDPHKSPWQVQVIEGPNDLKTFELK